MAFPRPCFAWNRPHRTIGSKRIGPTRIARSDPRPVDLCTPFRAPERATKTRREQGTCLKMPQEMPQGMRAARTDADARRPTSGSVIKPVLGAAAVAAGPDASGASNGNSPTGRPEAQRFPDGWVPHIMKWILGGLAALAVIGTVGYLAWNGEANRIALSLLIMLFYLPPPYLALYVLAPGDETGTVALVDRACATIAALGLLAFWGWFVTIPPTPQNAQAPAGLFMVGWTLPAGFYGGFKLIAHELRRLDYW